MATTNDVLAWVKDDGGRSKYFKAEKVGDCVTRSIAIASGMDYKEVYDELFALAKSSPRDGVSRSVIRKYMAAKGYEWVSTMTFGKGVTNHLRKGEVPMQGAIICNCSRHLVAVIDGVVHDTYDPARDGGRAVYGYWIVKPAGGTPDGDKPAKQEATAKTETLAGCNGEDIVTGDYYKPLDRLPIQYTLNDKHYIAGDWTRRERFYTLKSDKDNNGVPYYWYEENGKPAIVPTRGKRDDESDGRAALLDTINDIFKLMHKCNANHRGLSEYKVSVKYA